MDQRPHRRPVARCTCQFRAAMTPIPISRPASRRRRPPQNSHLAMNHRQNAHMDSGAIAVVGAVAAVLGAAVGAAGAVGTAAVSGRRQADSQHDHWRRQVRRDAYVTFMTSLSECAAALNEAQRHYVPDNPQAQRYGAYRDEAVAQFTIAQKAGVTIHLEGPPRIHTATTKVSGRYISG